MILTLALTFLLSLMPLVIGTLCVRYSDNIFSRAIVGLSGVSFLLGLLQVGLLIGSYYRLMPLSLLRQSNKVMEWVPVVGGVLMVVAGLMWIGYFFTLMGGSPKKGAPRRTKPEAKAAEPTLAAADVLAPPRPAVRLAAVTTSKKKPATAQKAEKPEGAPKRRVRMKPSSPDQGSLL